MKQQCGARPTRPAAYLLILCLMLFLPGCGTNPPRVITEYQTVTVYLDKYVQLPAYLVAPVEQVERPTESDTVALGASLKACRVRIEQANGQLIEIKALGSQP